MPPGGWSSRCFPALSNSEFQSGPPRDESPTMAAVPRCGEVWPAPSWKALVPCGDGGSGSVSGGCAGRLAQVPRQSTTCSAHACSALFVRPLHERTQSRRVAPRGQSLEHAFWVRAASRLHICAVALQAGAHFGATGAAHASRQAARRSSHCFLSSSWSRLALSRHAAVAAAQFSVQLSRWCAHRSFSTLYAALAALRQALRSWLQTLLHVFACALPAPVTTTAKMANVASATPAAVRVAALVERCGAASGRGAVLLRDRPWLGISTRGRFAPGANSLLGSSQADWGSTG